MAARSRCPYEGRTSVQSGRSVQPCFKAASSGYLLGRAILVLPALDRTVQEVALASALELRCGSSSILGDTFFNAIRILCSAVSDPPMPWLLQPYRNAYKFGQLRAQVAAGQNRSFPHLAHTLPPSSPVVCTVVQSSPAQSSPLHSTPLQCSAGCHLEKLVSEESVATSSRSTPSRVVCCMSSQAVPRRTRDVCGSVTLCAWQKTSAEMVVQTATYHAALLLQRCVVSTTCCVQQVDTPSRASHATAQSPSVFAVCTTNKWHGAPNPGTQGLSHGAFGKSLDQSVRSMAAGMEPGTENIEG